MNCIREIKAEVERRNLANYCGTAEQYEEELFAILDTLEAEEKEVDLNEEIDKFMESVNNEATIDETAEYFYNLGHNSKK